MNGKTARIVNVIGICFFLLSVATGTTLFICGLATKNNEFTKTMLLCSSPISISIGCLICLVTLGLSRTIKLEEIIIEQNKEIIRVQTKLK